MIAPSPVASLRRDMRRLGIRRASRAWGITPTVALSIVGGLGGPQSAQAQILRTALRRVGAGR